MNIFRKKPSDYEWLTAAQPFFDQQQRLVDEFEEAVHVRESLQEPNDADRKAFAEAFFQLYTQTRENWNGVNKIGTPRNLPAKRAHKSLRKTLKLWKIATEEGRKHFRGIANGLVERASSGGTPGGFSNAALVSQATLFFETMKQAHESLDFTASLIESVENEILYQMLPSRTIGLTQYGKEILTGIEGLAELLDSGFMGWEPPYMPLAGKIEYDEEEEAEISKAITVEQRNWGSHIDTLAPKHRSKSYQILVQSVGIAKGLLEISSIRCRKSSDYGGALHSWLKWYTNRSRRDGWGLEPEAWILLTEIYIGLKDVAKAKQTLVSATIMAAAELEQCPLELARSYLLPKRLEQLDQLCRKVQNLDA